MLEETFRTGSHVSVESNSSVVKVKLQCAEESEIVDLALKFDSYRPEMKNIMLVYMTAILKRRTSTKIPKRTKSMDIKNSLLSFDANEVTRSKQ